MITSIIIPTYDEELSIKSMARFILGFLIGVFNEGKIIIIGDGSTDNTQTIHKKLIAKNSEINNISVSALDSSSEISDLRYDASYWVNQSAARYSEVESISAVEK